MAQKSLYEIARELSVAFQRQDEPTMTALLRELVLFFPLDEEGKPYAHTVLDWIAEEPRDPVDRSSLTVPRV